MSEYEHQFPFLPVDAPSTPGPSQPVETAARPILIPASQLPAVRESDREDEEDETPGELPAGWASTIGSSLSSMVFHLVAFILLALWVIPPNDSSVTLVVSTDPQQEEPFETVFLDEALRPATQMAFTARAADLADTAVSAPEAISTPQVESSLAEADDSRRTAINQWLDSAPGSGDLLTRLSAATPAADSRSVVDNYQQALDRITQEILRMLQRGKVQVTWCFDQSESMKDDQQEICDRIERVYAELEMAGATSGEALTTAVTSFGADFAVHTPHPTADVEAIRRAIDEVPVDPSGEEMMCRAVSQSIVMFQRHAAAGRRQMALILVSDESGNREENQRYLEPTIAQALDARCRVYVLGREAVFGYPYAHVRWTQPETGQQHLLPVDRGPETAFVEQLQTEGFQKRTDAHPSGFGPYAQSRLAWATGGIFFLLPSVESDLYRGEKRRYQLEAMEPYQPDLRSPAEILRDCRRRPDRAVIWKIVNDLNPYRKEQAERIELRTHFSTDAEQFGRQLQEAQAKAAAYYGGLQRGIEALEARRADRDAEPARRWQANYDLLRAQLEAYAARVYLYRQALAEAARVFEETPKELPGGRQLVRFQLEERPEVPLDEQVKEMIERSRELFMVVGDHHPGTPWAARARWEMRRLYDDTHYDGRITREADDGGPSPTELAATDGPATVTTGVGIGVGGGGGGGGGGGVGIGFSTATLVPEYRRPRPADAGGHPRPAPPAAPRTPLPKL